jgi:CubicO group peptidase (beta-lactamase class C family)
MEQLLYENGQPGVKNKSTSVILKILRKRHFFGYNMTIKPNGMMKKNWLYVALLLTIYQSSLGQQQDDNPTIAIERLKKDIPELMKRADIPGISVALIHHGKLVWSNVYGVGNAVTQRPVTAASVFEAASLSKPVFAYGVLKLVDEGKLNLDTPLNKYLGNNYDVVDDPRINLITARRVLSHTSGFPNWRDFDHTKNLLIHFTPGEKWSYSGEGMVYLARVVEKITGLSLEDYMQKMVLQPLGMTSSSYIWQDRYDSLKVYRHDVMGDTSGRIQTAGGQVEAIKEGGNAAASLSTNAVDYSKFIIALLNGTGLKKSTREQLFTPQIRVNEKYPQLAWGLGVGLETMPEGEYFWHWGDNGDGKAFVIGFLPGKNALVYFANSANGLSITREILADGIGGEHPSLAHLGYRRYSGSPRALLNAIRGKGVVPALAAYREQRDKDSTQRIDEEGINIIGYYLLRLKKNDDAIEVFRQNTVDYPDSYNTWDSFAEAYMDKGDKELAIKYYEKSLELNPNNDNGKEQLKKLRQ